MQHMGCGVHDERRVVQRSLAHGVVACCSDGDPASMGPRVLRISWLSVVLQELGDLRVLERRDQLLNVGIVKVLVADHQSALAALRCGLTGDDLLLGETRGVDVGDVDDDRIDVGEAACQLADRHLDELVVLGVALDVPQLRQTRQRVLPRLQRDLLVVSQVEEGDRLSGGIVAQRDLGAVGHLVPAVVLVGVRRLIPGEGRCSECQLESVGRDGVVEERLVLEEVARHGACVDGAVDLDEVVDLRRLDGDAVRGSDLVGDELQKVLGGDVGAPRRDLEVGAERLVLVRELRVADAPCDDEHGHHGGGNPRPALLLLDLDVVIDG